MTAEPEPLRLLYIDDDSGFVALARRALGRQAVDVIHAAGGEAGLALLDDGRWDAIALDHFMPGLSGDETLQRIMTRPDPPPVIYVTGADEGKIAVAALKAGAADYVVKDPGETFFELLGATVRQAVAAARLRVEREAALRALAEARDRAELLLHEVNHRVANSLALVSSLAELQAGLQASLEAREALLTFRRRVSAIAQVHKRLFGSGNVGAVDLPDYLAGLVEDLSASLAGNACAAPIRLSAQPVTVRTDRAISLGIAVAELVTNACKYAYPPGTAGEIRVILERDGSEACLAVEDDGQGIGEGAPRGTGLGSRILKAMARAVGGQLVQVPRKPGTRIELRFPAG